MSFPFPDTIKLIQFREDLALDVHYNLKDHTDVQKEHFFEMESFEVFVLDSDEKNNTVDIQFEDGFCAFGVDVAKLRIL